ncbi:MAG: hypothetical protein WB988_03755, partial [Candidatus Nitrosopolaris sp.]
RPIVITTGSHKKTCRFGTITFDGRQLFRQYDTFDQYSFISYLRELKGKFHKLILFQGKKLALLLALFEQRLLLHMLVWVILWVFLGKNGLKKPIRTLFGSEDVIAGYI